MANELEHFGIPGMHWGVRRAEKHNERVLKTGRGTFKPTYQYRDTQGNLVSRYGKGPYGGGPKPTNNPSADKKFMANVEKMSKRLDSSGKPVKTNVPRSSKAAIESMVGKYGDEPVSKFVSTRRKVRKVATVVVAAYAGLVAVNFIADKVLWATGTYNRL